MQNDNYLRTNEYDDVLGSIRHAIVCSRLVENDPQAYKWGILALHSALQGACVCHLVDSIAPLGVVYNQQEWIDYFNNRDENKRPKTKLKSLPELLNALQNSDTYKNGKIEISKKEYDRLKYFNDKIRNQFVHFEPQGWSLEISGLPDFACLIAKIIKEIHSKGYAFCHLHDDEQTDLINNLEELKYRKSLIKSQPLIQVYL